MNSKLMRARAVILLVAALAVLFVLLARRARARRSFGFMD